MKAFKITFTVIAFLVFFSLQLAIAEPPELELAQSYLAHITALEEMGIDGATYLNSSIATMPDCIPIEDRIAFTLAQADIIIVGGSESVIVADNGLAPRLIEPTTINEETSPVDPLMQYYYPHPDVSIVKVDLENPNVVNSDSGARCLVVRDKNGGVTVTPIDSILAQ
jgi:hypothetical protein